MSSVLFSPYRLAGLELANRIVVSPMCQYSADDGCANDWHLMHLGMLANSGAALVVVEATHVERHGRITHGCLGLYSDDNEAALARVIAQVRRAGTAKFGIQIAHAGRKASSQRPWEGGGALTADADPWPTIAASPIPWGDNWHTPRMVTEDDMGRVRAAFVSAAKRALRIGFDAIELHFAHGYLAHGFMSPISNKRSDDYGGAFENRLRFPLSIARAVRAVVPKDVPLGARITGSDWREGGLDATMPWHCESAQGEGLTSSASPPARYEIRNPTEPGYNADRRARREPASQRAVGDVAPEHAEQIVAQGRRPGLAARLFLDDPHWGCMQPGAFGADVARPPQYARAGPARGACRPRRTMENFASSPSCLPLPAMLAGTPDQGRARSLSTTTLIGSVPAWWRCSPSSGAGLAVAVLPPRCSSISSISRP